MSKSKKSGATKRTGKKLDRAIKETKKNKKGTKRKRIDYDEDNNTRENNTNKRSRKDNSNVQVDSNKKRRIVKPKPKPKSNLTLSENEITTIKRPRKKLSLDEKKQRLYDSKTRLMSSQSWNREGNRAGIFIMSNECKNMLDQYLNDHLEDLVTAAACRVRCLSDNTTIKNADINIGNELIHNGKAIV